ncbi:MAG: dihydrolipoyl dehydrogenase [Actinomycetota bacterium]
MSDDYDVAVIGAGTGGYSCALRAAELGARVVLIDRDERLGGTCLLRGCIPTKALLRSAEVADTVERSEEWGVVADGHVDWPAVVAFENRIVDKLVSGVTTLVNLRRIEVVRGTATLVPGTGDRRAIDVAGHAITAGEVVIATGSRPRLLPGVPVTERILTSDQALWLDRIPASVVIVGAGAVGLEFASMYRSFGAEVTLLEAAERLAPLEDEESSTQIARGFRRRKISATTSVNVAEVKDAGDRVDVTYEREGTPTTVSSEVCLVAIGREPVTDDLGLEAAGVELERGFVKVDSQLQTTASHVWAVGDVAATPLQLAHVAFTEGFATAERIAGQQVPEIDYTQMPRVTYCSPEIASIGLTEAQARARGEDVQVQLLDLKGIGKANILGEGGLVKVVARTDGPILGIHMVGPHATDLIAEGMLITNWEATAAELAELHHPHPSLSEAFGESFLALAGKPLHSA